MLLMDDSKLDLGIFEAQPLLGCYMLCCSTLSDILNMTAVEFGLRGWMDDVEYIKKKQIDPIRRDAKQFIDSSVWQVKGLSMLEGDLGTKERIKKFFKEHRRGGAVTA